ncbi:hypothetical protein QQ25_01065 [Mycolicibacterium setense]|nr:hypothetical protein QQ25_01065 [Mycolicibacterium setense]
MLAHIQQTTSGLLDNASSHFKPSGYSHGGNHKGAQVRPITLCVAAGLLQPAMLGVASVRL